MTSDVLRSDAIVSTDGTCCARAAEGRTARDQTCYTRRGLSRPGKMARSDAGRWVIRTGVRPAARMRLICLPHAGAAASAYRQWSAEIAPEIEVLSVQLPGRETRILEPALTSLPDLVHHLSAAL